MLDPVASSALQPLPDRGPPRASSATVCPAGAPVKDYSVAAVGAPLPMLDGGIGKLYVLQADKAATLDGSRAPEPLVLHVNLGDCVTVELSHETGDGAVSFHVDMLDYNPMDSGGIEAGVDPPQAVAPGQTRTYTYFATRHFQNYLS